MRRRSGLPIGGVRPIPAVMDRGEIEASLRQRSADLSACTQQFLETIHALRERGQADVETIWNAAFHVNLVDHDLSAFLYFHTTTDDVWAQRLVARSLVTLLYEAIEDLPTLMGGSFIKACKTAGIYAAIEAEHRVVGKKLNVFKQAHHDFLKKVRSNAGAHKDHDAVQVMLGVLESDPDKMIDLTCEFMDLLVELGRFCSRTIHEANSVYRAKGVIP